MLNKIPPLPDMEMMVGICGTCSHRIELPRWKANAPSLWHSVMKQRDPFGDLWYAECPACKVKSEELKGKGRGVGNRVYLMPMPKEKKDGAIAGNGASAQQDG